MRWCRTNGENWFVRYSYFLHWVLDEQHVIKYTFKWIKQCIYVVPYSSDVYMDSRAVGIRQVEALMYVIYGLGEVLNLFFIPPNLPFFMRNRKPGNEAKIIPLVWWKRFSSVRSKGVHPFLAKKTATSLPQGTNPTTTHCHWQINIVSKITLRLLRFFLAATWNRFQSVSTLQCENRSEHAECTDTIMLLLYCLLLFWKLNCATNHLRIIHVSRLAHI